MATIDRKYTPTRVITDVKPQTLAAPTYGFSPVCFFADSVALTGLYSAFILAFACQRFVDPRENDGGDPAKILRLTPHSTLVKTGQKKNWVEQTARINHSWEEGAAEDSLSLEKLFPTKWK